MTTTPEQRRAENDERVAADVATFGCHVVSVFDPDGALPTFSYSIGIQASSGMPEAIIIGLRPNLGHALINRYNDQVRQGRRFERGTPYPGFLDDFPVYAEPARRERLSDYTLGCDRFYQGAGYAVVQLIYPTTAGLWPWQRGVSETFRAGQPILGRRRPDRR